MHMVRIMHCCLPLCGTFEFCKAGPHRGSTLKARATLVHSWPSGYSLSGFSSLGHVWMPLHSGIVLKPRREYACFLAAVPTELPSAAAVPPSVRGIGGATMFAGMMSKRLLGSRS